MTREFTQARIDSLEAIIVAYEGAILALGTAGVQSYKLDTGQTVQTVTRADLSQLRAALDGLLNQHAVLTARLGGCGAPVLVRPVW